MFVYMAVGQNPEPLTLVGSSLVCSLSVVNQRFVLFCPTAIHVCILGTVLEVCKAQLKHFTIIIHRQDLGQLHLARAENPGEGPICFHLVSSPLSSRRSDDVGTSALDLSHDLGRNSEEGGR